MMVANSQCHIAQLHSAPIPYRLRRLVEVVSMVSVPGSGKFGDFIDARTGSSPILSVRISEVMVALELRTTAL